TSIRWTINTTWARLACVFPSSEKTDCDWSNESRNLWNPVLARNSLGFQLHQSRLFVGPNQQWCYQHCQLHSLLGKEVFDSGRDFIIGYAFHESVSLKVFQDIAQGLRAYAWVLLSQMIEPQLSLVSKLRYGTSDPFLYNNITELHGGPWTDDA